MKDWEIIADNLSKRGWTWGCVAAVNRQCDGSGARSIRIFSLMLAWFLFGSQSSALAAAGVFNEPTSLSQTMWAYVATYGTPLLAYVVLRTLTVHLVLHFMMKRAPGLDGAEESVAETQDSAALSKEDLHFFELNVAKGILLNEPYEDRLERALKTGRRTWGIFWKSLLVFAVASTISYVFFTAVRRQTAVDMESAGAAEINEAGSGQMGIVGYLYSCSILVALFFFVATVSNRYLNIRRVPLRSSISGVLLLAALAVGAGKAFALPFYLYVLPPICSTLMVAWGYAKIRRAARADGNIKLLILRVFGSDRNTSFVFGPLMRSWQFLGAFFTIVDPSYIRYQFSLSSSDNKWKLLKFFTVFGLLIGAFSWGQYFLLQFLHSTNAALVAWQELNAGQQRELIGMVAWLILIPLATLPILAIVQNRFVQSLPKLKRRIDDGRRQNGGWSGIFKGFPMYCYDNVWKKAVNALLQVSDVILMDLRGFSPARLGCEYEVGVLVNQCPIQKIVFLVDQAETKQAVYQLIRRRWDGMSATSPNRSLKSPTIKVYAPADQEAGDIPRILALLVASVEKNGESASSMVSFEGAQPWREAGVVRARSKAGWRRWGDRIAGRLDIAVSTPKYFRIIMPLMVVAVLGLLCLRLQPVVNAFKKYSNPKVAMLPESPQGAIGQPAPEGLATPAFKKYSNPKVVMLPESPQGAIGQPAPEGLATPAYLKTKADAKVSKEIGAVIDSSNGGRNNRTYSNPLEVRIDFTGGAASEAHRYGRIKITSAVSDTGEPLEVLRVGDSSPGDAQARFNLIDHSKKDFFTKQPEHPQDGFRLRIIFFKPTKEFAQVGSIAGTVTLQTKDPNQAVRIENIGSYLSGPGEVRLHDPKLDAFGEFSLMIRESDPETAHIIVKGKRLQDLDVRIVDAQRNLLRSVMPPEGVTIGDTKDFTFSAKNSSLMNAHLEIIFGCKSIEAPFEVKNIAIQK